MLNVNGTLDNSYLIVLISIYALHILLFGNVIDNFIPQNLAVALAPQRAVGL